MLHYEHYHEMWWLFVYTMKHCYATALYTTRYPLHLGVKVYRTREITTVAYGRNVENEPVSRTKMADYHALISTYGNAIAIFNTKALYGKKPNSFWSDHNTEPVSMTRLSRSCATSILEPWTDTHTGQLQ